MLAIQYIVANADSNMHPSLLVWLGLFLLVYFFLGGRKGVVALIQVLRTSNVMKAVMIAYRAGDYETAIEKAEKLKDGAKKTSEYCCVRGEMLHHIGRLDEAEASLREALSLHDDLREKALVHDLLAAGLMDQERYTEAITFYENAGRAWPDRGSNQRGIAEAWLRQGRELTEAEGHARQAVEIDRRGSGMPKEALDTRLGEDLAVLAWAVAANSGNVDEVDRLVTEAFELCGTRTKPILSQIHYYAGQAYEALNNSERARDHFRQAPRVFSQDYPVKSQHNLQ